MSTATLEQDLQQHIEHPGYRVSFRHAQSYSFIYCYVHYHGAVVGEKTFFGWYQWPRAARWAKKRIGEHEEAMRLLGGLV